FTGTVTDAVPAGTTFNGTGSCTPACTFDGTTVTWAGVTINPGTSTFTFGVTVTAAGGATAVNTGVLDPTLPNLDPIPSSPAQTEIGPDLAVVKFNSPTGTVASGNTIVYTLVISNETRVAAQNTVVTDPLPVGTSFVSCTTPASTTCGQSGGVVTWQLGIVPG